MISTQYEVRSSQKKVSGFRDLLVWQKSMDLLVEVYDAAKSFPKEEIYGLTGQIKRSVISLPSNIAEGFARKSSAEFSRFIDIAYGSLAEVETQLDIALKLQFMDDAPYKRCIGLASEIGKMLLSLKTAQKNNSANRVLRTAN